MLLGSTISSNFAVVMFALVNSGKLNGANHKNSLNYAVCVGICLLVLNLVMYIFRLSSVNEYKRVAFYLEKKRPQTNTLMFKIPKSAPTIQMAFSTVSPSQQRPLYLLSVDFCVP